MPKTRVEELVGTFSHVKNRFQSGMVIAALEDGSTVKGVLEDGEELIDGMTYRFMGRTDVHPRYGKQFWFSSFVLATPHTRRAVVKYLHTFAEGVGVVKAGELWDKFGPDAVKVLADEPARVVEAKILSPERAAEASETLRGMQATQATRIDLMGLLDGKGFPKKIVSALIKKFGASAAQDVREDPYLLLRHFKGAGFLRTDKLYLDLKHDPASLPRQMYCVWHHLRSSTAGHTWHAIEAAVQALRDSVSGAKLQPTKAIELGVREDRLAVWKDAIAKDGWVAEAAKAANERTVAEEVRRLLGVTGSLWPSHHALSERLTPHQREQLGLAMRLPVAILIGTPGTGKTFCAAAVAAALCRSVGPSNVAACAPTGKAAVRLTQKFREYDVPLAATTIHRLLKVGPSDDGYEFACTKFSPLEQKVFILDEASMVDTDLFAHLLSALPPAAHLFLVGDPNQLTPVGHGAPLRDMLSVAALPRGELTEIKRNAGLIVTACRDLKDGKPYETCARFDKHAGLNLRHVPCGTPEAAVETVESILASVLGGRKWDVLDDCQVIVAVNDKSPLARRRLNGVLQNLLNPSGKTAGSNPFRVSDKAICLKNGLNIPLKAVGGHSDMVEICQAVNLGRKWFTDAEGRDWYDLPGAEKTVFVANGEIGRVCAVDERLTVMRFRDPDRVIKVPMGRQEEDEDGNEKGRGCNFDLGYAVTGHKMQGSECPVVIVLIDDYPGASFVCSRNWWYTSLSRASELCITIGRQSTVEKHCRRVATNEPKTFLRELLGELLEPPPREKAKRGKKAAQD